MPNEYIIMLLCGYLIGSIPVATLLKRYRDSEIPDYFYIRSLNAIISKLISPVFRRLPSGWEQAVLDAWPIVVLNFVKGVVAALMAFAVIGSTTGMVAVGITTIWGNTWPVFLRFKSERGTSIILGVSLVVAPITTLIWCGFWLVFFALTRFSAVATLLSFSMFPLLLWWVKRRDLFVVFGVVCAILAVSQLVGEIQRILAGKTKSADLGGNLDEGDIEEEEEERDPPTKNNRLKARIALAVAAGLLALLWFGNKYVYRGFGMQVPVIRSGGPYLKAVALTFDDGPDPVYTPQILDILKQHNVKATFFLVGKHVDQYPEIAKRIVAEGHEIGGHSYSHPNLILMGKTRLIREVSRTEEAILKATGKRPYLFRPPRGLYNATLTEYLKANKYTMVLWTLSSRDWQEPSYKEITWRVTTGVKPGTIVLFHDSGSIISPDGGSRESTVQALPYIIKDLKEKGYRLVTSTDLIIMSDLDGHIQ